MSTEKCAYCGCPLVNVQYFCRPHWFELHGNERASFVRMHRTNQPMASKIARCVRLLTAKHATPTAQPVPA